MKYFYGTLALMMCCVFVAPASGKVTGEWTFDKGDLSATVGAPMEYRNDATKEKTKFAKATEFGLAPILGADSGVMKFPKCAPDMGYAIDPGTTGDRYTVLMDLCFTPAPRGMAALWQTDATNKSDGECFLNGGRLGISSMYDGQMGDGVWTRVVWSIDGQKMDKYLNGKPVGTRMLKKDERWALQGGKSVLLFTDDNNETAGGYVSKVQVYDEVLTPEQVAALGSLYDPQPELLTAPYLQDMQTTAMTVMWETATSGPGTIRYGLTSDYDMKAAATSIKSKAETFVHTASLTGLKPGTTYHYSVSNEDLPDTADATFETAPDTTDGDFMFTFWSDSQGAVNDNDTTPTVNMFMDMASRPIAFALAGGDLAEQADNPYSVRRYYLDRCCKYLGVKRPFFIAWGNHDAYNDPPPAGQLNFIRQHANQPSKYRTDRPGINAGRGSFSFTYRGVYFVCIDDLHPDDITNGWLDTELETTACLNARLRVCAVHRPPFSELWRDGNEKYRKELVPRLEKAGFDLCLSGHVHEYERGHLNGITYIVSGGASWLDHSEPVVKDWPHITVGGSHNMDGAPRAGLFHEYVLFTVKGDTLIGEMLAFEPNGAPMGIKDTFTIPLKKK